MKRIASLDQDRSVGAVFSNQPSKLIIKSEWKDTILERILEFACSVDDFRRLSKGNFRHRLCDVITLMLFARISKCVTRAEIIEFGRHNLNRLRKMGMFENGIPSEPTLCRIEHGINDLALANRMQTFVKQICADSLRKDGDEAAVICIDGKAQCGTVLANGRNPDIVSAYDPARGVILATEACQEKSNEIKAVPLLINKIAISGKIITADAMSMQTEIVDLIRNKGGDFVIELKANQRGLRYGVEDKIKRCVPVYSYSIGPELNHGRIETRTYRIYDGMDLIVDKEKWGGKMSVIEYLSDTIKKSTGEHSSEKRLYVSSLSPQSPMLGRYVRLHWSIESMHWGLDVNLLQDDIKRKTSRSARNLDTIQRIVYSTFSIWKMLRKKKVDKNKGIAQLMRSISMGFTKLIRFLTQKIK